MVRDIEQVGEHHLCYAVRAVRRNVRHNDATLACRLCVYHVVASSKHAYILRVLELGYDVGVEHRLVSKRNLCVAHMLQHFFGRCARINGKFAEFFNSIPRDIARVDALTV